MDFDVLHPIVENEFFFAEQFIVFLPNFLMTSNFTIDGKILTSKRQVKGLIEQKTKIILITKNSTFAKMRILNPMGHFAFFDEEEIMLGNNFNNRRVITREHAVPWETKGFISDASNIGNI